MAVEDRLHRALVVLRLVLTANLVALSAWRWDAFERPVAAALVVAGLVAWTAVVLWAYADARRRVTALLVLDLAVALAALLASPLLKGEDFQGTVPGFWVVGALMAWAVQWRWAGGLAAAGALAVADLSVRSEVTQSAYGNVFLIAVGGPIVGYLVGSLQEMAVERDHAQREAAAAAERARLARAVHDGVLQVLALVQRRGPELGPEGVGLGRLAADQESSLRALIRHQDAVPVGRDDPGAAEPTIDVAGALGGLERRTAPRVSVVTPGGVVLLEARRARELVAAAGACLDNVARHVGEEAQAWVLLEELPDRVVVSVRDEGPGIPAGRLEAAEREGRLGVRGSVVRRLRDIGGRARLETGPGGTEWELEAPR